MDTALYVNIGGVPGIVVPYVIYLVNTNYCTRLRIGLSNLNIRNTINYVQHVSV